MKTAHRNTRHDPGTEPSPAVRTHRDVRPAEPHLKPLKPAVSVIVPAYNEEASVGAQVTAIRHELAARGVSHEVIVIDDGSQDQTATEALRAGARVLQHSQNRG